MDPMTASTPTPLPPDPGAVRRAAQRDARRKGLEQPYIAGGEDPEIEETLRRERPYVQILIWMVVVIIAMGFVLGFIGAILGGPAA